MRHFSLAEFSRSLIAMELGLDNTPPPEAIVNIHNLCSLILDPLRDALGRPIRITSGYRNEKVNRHLKGAKNSQHRTGEAADIKIARYPPKQICAAIISLRLPFDQLINEFDSWVHVSYAANGKPRGEYLKASKSASNKTIYTRIDY